MPEPTQQTPAGQDPAVIKNQSGNEPGTDPTKTEKVQQPEAFDTSKVGDEDFNKVFDDPRLWKHPRFKGLNDRAKLADKYEADRQKAEEERLVKEKKFEELANNKAQEAEKYKTEAQTARIDNKVQAEAAKLGAVDLEAVLKLIDRTNIKVDENGSVVGADEAVKSLLESKPYLKGDGTQVTIGAPTNPGNEQKGVKKFKLSQIQDPKFYQENEKDITQALATGNVEDDTSK